MWAFADFATVECSPRCDTSIRKVAKLIFLQVTNLLNGYCFSEWGGHLKLIWLDEPKPAVTRTGETVIVRYPETNSVASHLISACDFHHQLLSSALPIILPPAVNSWLTDSESTFQSPVKTVVTHIFSSISCYLFLSFKVLFSISHRRHSYCFVAVL